MVNVINMTSEPHSIDGLTIEPSGVVAQARDQWKIHKNPPGVPMGTPRRVDNESSGSNSGSVLHR